MTYMYQVCNTDIVTLVQERQNNAVNVQRRAIPGRGWCGVGGVGWGWMGGVGCGVG